MNNTLRIGFTVNGIDYKNVKWQARAQANPEILPCTTLRYKTHKDIVIGIYELTEVTSSRLKSHPVGVKIPPQTDCRNHGKLREHGKIRLANQSTEKKGTATSFTLMTKDMCGTDCNGGEINTFKYVFL